jgi:integrase
MPTITFTARTVDRLKPTPGQRVEYFDVSVPGLALRITERGAKTWTLLYRHRGRPRRLTLGSAAAVSLADARARARDAIGAAAKGADPAAEKQDARQAETIEDLAREYIARYAKRRKRSWKEDDRMLRLDILPAWQHRAIVDITRRDVRALIEAIAARGAPIGANRTLSLISKVFRFAVDEEMIDVSPAVRIPRPALAHQRDRVLSDDEIRAVWHAFEALPAEMAAYFKLRLITAQRGAEVSSMRWQDVDRASGWWTIPSADSKNKLAHRVPLSAAALAIIEALATTATPAAVYVLDGARGRRQQSEAARTFTVADFRGHDLRRTAASLMAGGGIPRLVIGKILNHVEKDITAVYDRHSYDAEKKAALNWWALKLAAILDNKSGVNVLAFGRGA